MLLHFPEQSSLTSIPADGNPLVRRHDLLKQLTEQHKKSSERILRLLAKHTDAVREVKALWITNSLRLEVKPALAQLLKGMNSIVEVESELPKFAPPEIAAAERSNSPAKEKSWGIFGFGVDKLWDGGIKGKGIVIGLIDTGANLKHPDLAGSAWKNSGEIPGNKIDDDGNGYVDDISGWNFIQQNSDTHDTIGHGTQAAGILSGDGALGLQTGVAPAATVMVLKTCCQRGGEVFESRTWEAIQYAIQNGAHVISMSMSIKHYSKPHYDKWRRVGEVLLAAGVLLVDSAGNYGSDHAPHNLGAPASNPPAWLHPGQQNGGKSSNLTIGAIQFQDQVYPSSSTGPVTWENSPTYGDYPMSKDRPGLIKPDLCGPSGIPTASKDGKSYVKSFEGTSAATPFMAGAIALLLSAKPSLLPAQITEALQMTATPVGTTFNNQCGAGKPNFPKAWEYIQKKF